MTNGEAKVLETDVVIFPMKFGNQTEEKASEENQSKTLEIKEPVRVDKSDAYARLKKSLRIKSSGIL